MKAYINEGVDGGQQGCTGHARCEALAGDVYQVDDNGYNLFRGTSIDVPPGLEESARYGAKVCPERAIRIEE
ncbi:ferredoxin [Rhodococcus sp. YH3-3]|uniref:ferredoxin n=1 Tax=Rhodococcus sp. YH3-3 TaxID=1803579 RepID=UPI0007DB15C8|nr:ferredoxin [Rhodococcus sp. YH3-3]